MNLNKKYQTHNNWDLPIIVLSNFKNYVLSALRISRETHAPHVHTLSL